MSSSGRPSKYTPELLEKAQAYLDGKFEEQGEIVPTQEGLAMYIGVHRSTLHDWKNKEGKERFSDILEGCNQKQTIMLMSGALSNVLNPNIAKLMLGKQGYSDKQETELTGKGGGPIEARWVIQPVKPKDA